MIRAERFVRIGRRIDGVKKHAKEKGDGVLADKMRKIEIDLNKLINNESAEHLARECD